MKSQPTKILIVVSLLFACGRASTAPPETPAYLATLPTAEVSIADKSRIHVVVANTPESRARGLMRVRTLGEFDGMLFIPELTPSDSPFFMKDTKIALDIVFWDAEGKIIDAFTMTPCGVDPCPLYRASGLYVGALEVLSETIKREKWNRGDIVKVELQSRDGATNID